VTIRLRISALALLSALGVAAGCGSNGNEGGGPCTTGESRTCVCPTGSEGTQICPAEGVWGTCTCSGDGSGGNSGDPPEGSGGSQTSGSGGSGDPPDADAVASVAACIDTLPDWAQQNASSAGTETAIINAIIAACDEFAPAGAEWQTYCRAHLAGAIVAESSYDATSVVVDSYAERSVDGQTAYDPTVGLLQIRFSSTVRDFHDNGPMDALARIGCSFQNVGSQDEVFWATGANQYLSMMQEPACNIAFAAWYYYIHATGNGGTQVTYAWAYCNGEGVAGNLAIGLLSHLRGPAGAIGADVNDAYVTSIRGYFDGCLGSVPSPHPFEITLQPEPSKYCG